MVKVEEDAYVANGSGLTRVEIDQHIAGRRISPKDPASASILRWMVKTKTEITVDGRGTDPGCTY